MTILGLMQEVFPLASLHMESDGCHANLMGEDNDKFWLKDVPEDTMKEICKRFINKIYGIPNAHILVKSDYIDTDSTQEFMTPPVETNTDILWVKVPTEILNEDCQHIMEIIDDASVNGLNFQYLNGEWYFGETQGDPK